MMISPGAVLILLFLLKLFYTGADRSLRVLGQERRRQDVGPVQLGPEHVADLQIQLKKTPI